jgi:hypothetical protein
VEEAVRTKLANLGTLLGSSTEDARTALEGLLDGPLIASREEGPDGHRLRLHGRVVLGTQVTQRDGQVCVPPEASPEGFEPSLAT